MKRISRLHTCLGFVAASLVATATLWWSGCSSESKDVSPLGKALDAKLSVQTWTIGRFDVELGLPPEYVAKPNKNGQHITHPANRATPREVPHFWLAVEAHEKNQSTPTLNSVEDVKSYVLRSNRSRVTSAQPVGTSWLVEINERTQPVVQSLQVVDGDVVSCTGRYVGDRKAKAVALMKRVCTSLVSRVKQ